MDLAFNEHNGLIKQFKEKEVAYINNVDNINKTT